MVMFSPESTTSLPELPEKTTGPNASLYDSQSTDGSKAEFWVSSFGALEPPAVTVSSPESYMKPPELRGTAGHSSSCNYSQSPDIRNIASEALLKVEREKNKILKENNSALRRQLFVSNQKSKRRLESNKKMKCKLSKTIIELKKQRKEKTSNESLGKQARENPVIYDTLKNITKKPKARRYHQETIKFASSVYLSGPKTYRFIRDTKKIVLPHKNSVYRYNKHIRIQPGLNETLLRAVKKKVKKIRSKKEKVVAISIDGMSVKPELTCSAKADMFYGFTDFGKDRKFEKNKTTELATEAVCVMVSGIYRNFKQVIMN
ncbi:uncharacterized protein LOC134284962 [Aedes albopictus]|uniref:Transposable element P transposase-like RNase H domain-containing protein n=1 Tax=Aedes albopictus TaxID=7160 RepID=A0ABM1ZC09_AEDAL